MQAAAHTPGGYGGVPQSVGKEFVGDTAQAATIKVHGLDVTIETAKGELRKGTTNDGTAWEVKMPVDYGFIRRTEGADGDQLDCFIGPNPESTAVFIIDQLNMQTGAFDEHKVLIGFDGDGAALDAYRASFSDGRGSERIGRVWYGDIAALSRDIESAAGGVFEPRHDAAIISKPSGSGPDPLNDRQVAEGIRDGTIESPAKYGDFWLFDLRITGTGAAYRDSIDEWAVRDPEQWLSPEFVDRCNGLLVVFGHPERSGVNHDEFQERGIGTIVLPYIKGDEVWGIAKIFDADAALCMQTTHRSTSPGVVPPQGSQALALKDGTKVLAEDLPLVLDHLAVCEVGVWDKAGPPDGIRLDTRKDAHDVKDEDLAMMDRAKRDAARAKFDEMDRMDAAGEKTEERDDAKKDESEKEALEAAEAEKADKAKKDAAEDEKSKDDAKKDAAVEDKTDRKDGAPVDKVEDKTELLKDSVDVQALQREIATMRTQLGHLSKPQSIDDRNAIAAAYHRADRLYQMLGDAAPQSLAGESVRAYRARLATGLRKYTDAYKTYAFHDSLDGQAFDLVEAAIYEQAGTYAKNPTHGDVTGKLREVTHVRDGKTYREFYGDSNACWAPFMPVRRQVIRKFNNHPRAR